LTAPPLDSTALVTAATLDLLHSSNPAYGAAADKAGANAMAVAQAKGNSHVFFIRQFLGLGFAKCKV
jgi:hypothetical protein